MSPGLVVRSFLGEIAAPHYVAVARAVGQAAGIELAALVQTDLADLDRSVAAGPALLFLCGLPYVLLRDRGLPVEPLAAPVATGDDAPRYGSAVVLGAGVDIAVPADLEGREVAFNGEGSLSGWVLPRHGLGRLGVDPDGLRWRRSGGHRASLRLLVEGGVEAAPIDTSVLTLEARADPRVAALRTLVTLGPLPSPPVVIAGGDAVLASRLRRALVSLDGSSAGRAALALGAVERFAPVDDATYDLVRALL